MDLGLFEAGNMSYQVPDKEYVYSALLRYNYLPMGKLQGDDIPFKVFSTEDFMPDVVNEMLEKHGMAKRRGYDQIEYRTNRFNNVTRLMHVCVNVWQKTGLDWRTYVRILTAA